MRSNVKVMYFFLIAVLLIASFPCIPVAAATKTATVNATSLNVRTEPSSSSKQIGSLKKGSIVTVFNVEKGWANISFQDRKAWVSSAYLKENGTNSPSKPSLTKENTAKTAKVTATSLNVRSGAGTQYKAIGSLKNGTIVSIVKEEENWTSITYGSMKGWVSSAYLLNQNGTAPTIPKPSATNPVNSGKWGRVTATYLNFRSAGNLSSPIIGSLKYDTSVQVVSESGSWLYIQTTDGKKGWVSSQYISIQTGGAPIVTNPKPATKPPVVPPSSVSKKVVIMSDGVNIRQGPSTAYLIVGHVNQGDEFAYLQSKNDWVQIKLPSGKSAWVAGWLVALQLSASPNSPSTPKPTLGGLKGKRIVIDPGHGGNDPGTSGKSSGTQEASMTLMSARLLATQLSNAGAKVILTRSDNTYISLNKRVEISHYHFADAFVSLHYNSATDKSATGLLTFYYGQKDLKLANSVNTGLVQANTGLKGGNVRYGNFHVLRENKQPAVLVELGFLSNPFDELTVKSNSFQTKAATGITAGLAQYFQ
ncbi:SH3 domain-containing protein [Fictibacillus phosphorivorans]|uniref:SH3 domain-containing protein n=1 Tax=Fictibacillus phosphorivorans TaxID=1221500 RepID=UPI0012930994|nr:SH3 domain-containing protein [Fictibacillus phosphorivorans]MQR96894.1 N-acetylmuramoyl-L-alanine amidase [Fictibacillus phosphorivorans]